MVSRLFSRTVGATVRRSVGTAWPPWRAVRWGLGVGLLDAGAWLGFVAWVAASTAPLVYGVTAADLPVRHVALVFGAGLDGQGGPSAVLYDRVATGAALYRAGKVAKLLMSGDNSQPTYNEVGVMRQTALDLGVPSADIVLDYAGFRTYDSCYRARDVFGLRAATLVTNRFHLPRALYTCRELGLDVVGVDADRRTYADTPYWTLRDWVALPVAGWWTHTNRQPTFLGPVVDVDHPPVQP